VTTTLEDIDPGLALLSGPTAFVASGVVDPALWSGDPTEHLAEAGVPR